MRLTTLLITLTLFSACREKQSRNLQLQEQTVTGDRVEVIYFHGKQRCMTCKSIEEQTKELLTGSLAEAVKTGQIVYRTVDISDKEGEKIADQYEVTWSSLFVNRWKDGQEQRNNMTEFAFSKATSDPEGFKAGLKEKNRNIDEIMESPDILMNSGLPVVTAFVLGLLTAISPCPLATNITAIGFISRDIGNRKRIFRNGLLYTLGRIITYTVLGLLVIPILREGASMFAIQKGISQWGEWIISPLLLLTGGFMLWGQRLNLPKFGFSGDNEKLQNLKGGVGSLTLGILFALAFCPTSGVFYFGLLIPMAAISTGGMWFPVVFAVATALPVAVVAWLLAYSIAGIGRFYNRLQVFERWMRRIVGWLFTGTGLYYLIRLL